MGKKASETRKCQKFPHEEMTTITETAIKTCNTKMDTSRRCVSAPARLDRESEAETQPCETENSSLASSVPASIPHKTFSWNATALSTAAVT